MVTEPVVGFLDAEELAVAYLTDELDRRRPGVHVATRTPTSREPEMVKVTRTGGLRRDMVTDTPQLTFECWAASDSDAYDLARLVRALIWALPGRGTHGRYVRHVDEIGGPTYFEDPDTTSPRYQLTVELSTRGSEL